MEIIICKGGVNYAKIKGNWIKVEEKLWRSRKTQPDHGTCQSSQKITWGEKQLDEKIIRGRQKENLIAQN